VHGLQFEPVLQPQPSILLLKLIKTSVTSSVPTHALEVKTWPIEPQQADRKDSQERDSDARWQKKSPSTAAKLT